MPLVSASSQVPIAVCHKFQDGCHGAELLLLRENAPKSATSCSSRPPKLLRDGVISDTRAGRILQRNRRARVYGVSRRGASSGGFEMRRLALLTFTAAVLHVPAAMAATCDSLAVLSLQNAHITSAQLVAAGAFTAPPAPAVAGREGAAGRGGARAGGARGGGRGANQPSPYAALPAFCRVAATLTPSSDSEIR